MLSHTVELMKSSQGERPDGLPGEPICSPARLRLGKAFSMNLAGMDESMARLTSQALEHRTLLMLAASFRVAEAVSLDILEEEVVPRQIEVNGNIVRFSYRPREIITLLLRPSR